MKYLVSGLFVMLFASAAFAGQWYDRADTSYENEGDGTIFGFYGGCRQEISKYLSLAWQARVSANNSEWTMTLTEPANFKYRRYMMIQPLDPGAWV